MMKELNNDILETVAGGASRASEQTNATLTQITSSIKDLASSQNNNGSSSTTTMLMMAMMMGNRNQTVVAQPTTVVQPAFSFRARVRF